MLFLFYIISSLFLSSFLFLPSSNRAVGAVAASDAFFPFPDGLRILLEGGVRAVVQPGGSVRDAAVVAVAEEAGVTMYLTGTRHFAH